MPVKIGKAWLLATLVGSVGFGIWIGMVLSIQAIDDPMDRMLTPFVDWIEGLIPAAIVALFIVLWALKKVVRQRNNRFTSQYLPGFQQFLAPSDALPAAGFFRILGWKSKI